MAAVSPNKNDNLSKKTEETQIKIQQSANKNQEDIHCNPSATTEKENSQLEINLEEVKEKCLQEIKFVRKEIDHFLDKMEEACLADLQDVLEETDAEKASKQSITNKKEINASISADALKLSPGEIFHDSINNKVHNARDIEEELPGKKEETSSSKYCAVTFIKNTKLLDAIKSHQSLGSFHFPSKLDVYASRDSKYVNVRHETDKEDCSIYSICLIGSGDILMADYKNKSLKLLERSNYIIRDALSLNLYPLSVCSVNRLEAAAGLSEIKYFGGENIIQFLSTTDKLIPTRSVKVDHCCAGINVYGSKIYVTNQRKRLYVYSLEGKLLKTLYIDNTGNEIFSKSYAIAENTNGKMIHVTDLDKGLITLDTEGNVLWKYSGSNLAMAWGVCTDGEGNVFVAGSNSCNIVQIALDGKFVGEVVSVPGGMKDPQAVCFDKNTSELFVTRYNNNNLYICSLCRGE